MMKEPQGVSKKSIECPTESTRMIQRFGSSVGFSWIGLCVCASREFPTTTTTTTTTISSAVECYSLDKTDRRTRLADRREAQHTSQPRTHTHTSATAWMVPPPPPT